MYLLLRPEGSRYWRLDYRFDGKRKTLALGVYPEVSLAEARKRRQAAKAMLAEGQDPGAMRKGEQGESQTAHRTGSAGLRVGYQRRGHVGLGIEQRAGSA